MSAGDVLSTLWAAMNSPVGVSVFAAVMIWLLNKVYAAQPAWREFEGSIIAAVKYAEKQIPDDVENAGVRRLDQALKFVAAVYEKAKGRAPTTGEAAALKEGIQIMHAELEAAGNLTKAA